MARYQVRGPDGAVHIIEGPDGASPQDIETAAAQMVPPPAAKTAAPQPTYDPSAGGSTLNVAGFDTGIKTPQWLDRTLSGVGASVVNTTQGLGNLVGMVPQSTLDESEKTQKPLMATGAGQAGNVLGQAAQMVTPMGVASKIAPAVKTFAAARPFLTAGATSGAFGAIQPVLDDGSRTVNALTSAAGGVVGQGLASGLGAVARGARDVIAPEVKALYAKAQAMGIPVTLSQLSDSTFVKTLQSTLAKLPFSGAGKVAEEQGNAFTRAVSRTFGEDTPKVDSGLYALAKTRIGGDFNRLSANNSLNPTPALANDLGAVSAQATKFANSDTSRAVANAIDEIMSKVDPATGQIPGAAYQSFDSAMGKLMKGGDEKAHFIGQVRDAVRSAMDASISPADQAAWKTARSQYANLKTVRDLIAKDDGSGTISPAALMGRVTATGAGKERMATGNGGDMGDLAQIGKRFLRDPIPDSGTAQRSMLYSLLGGGGATAASMLGASPTQIALGLGAAAGTSLLGRTGNALLNSKGLANYALNGAGPVVNALAVGARPAPYLLPAYLDGRK